MSSSRCWIKIAAPAFREVLLAWYDRAHRDLPWRATQDFYRVWISEIMLQQTRVEAVLPYYERFLARFPDAQALAAAAEPEILTFWSGLGYYSRARNLHRAARQIVQSGTPERYEDVAALPGVGPYTSAAIASIALGLPHAAMDGNVVRVVSRLVNEGGESTAPAVRARLALEAGRLLDRERPGDFNQAMMELGATVCVPRVPSCKECPVERFCAARAAGRERELPIRKGKPGVNEIRLDLDVFVKAGRVFLVQRAAAEKRLAGFWELPVRNCGEAGSDPEAEFSHAIVNDRFRVRVWRGDEALAETLGEGRWFSRNELKEAPVTTITRKAIERLPFVFSATGVEVVVRSGGV